MNAEKLRKVAEAVKRLDKDASWWNAWQTPVADDELWSAYDMDF